MNPGSGDHSAADGMHVFVMWWGGGVAIHRLFKIMEGLEFNINTTFCHLTKKTFASHL